MPRSFRITQISGPEGIGPINSHYHFYVEFDYDPGAPLEQKRGRAVFRLRDAEANTLATGQVDYAPFDQVAIARLAFLATEKLTALLAAPEPELRQLLTLSYDELRRGLDIDPKRVQYGEWVPIPDQLARTRRRAFISCGQQSHAERELGHAIAGLVRANTGLEGYFAEYQTSLEGMTSNIFNALYESAGFIAVMHRRDELAANAGVHRGSVWIEQEIAIAAFMVQTLGVSLPSRAYVQSGIDREGVRGFIILNPVEFDSDQEVLSDLATWWPSLLSTLE